jgi:hypothetical protein
MGDDLCPDFERGDVEQQGTPGKALLHRG